jgi:biopolymer transport protein ExbB/TolQ
MTALKTIGLWLCYPVIWLFLIVTAPLWIVAIFIFARQMDQLHDVEYEALWRRVDPDPMLEAVGYREDEVTEREQLAHASRRTRRAARFIP